MGRRIDLNADMGEGFGAWTMGADQELLAVAGVVEEAARFSGRPVLSAR